MKRFLKKNNGIAVADALIAILIMSIFLGLTATLTYNIYISASFTKRNSIATDYAIKITEYIDKLDYDDVTYSNLKTYINETLDGNSSKISAETEENASSLTTPYRAILKIEKYNKIEGNEDKQDLIKTVTLQIKYNLGEKEKNLVYERVKQR